MHRFLDSTPVLTSAPDNMSKSGLSALAIGSCSDLWISLCQRDMTSLNCISILELPFLVLNFHLYWLVLTKVSTRNYFPNLTNLYLHLRYKSHMSVVPFSRTEEPPAATHHLQTLHGGGGDPGVRFSLPQSPLRQIRLRWHWLSNQQADR